MATKSSNGKILIIELNVLVSKIIKSVKKGLSNNNFDVYIAKNIRDVINIIDKYDIKYVFLNFNNKIKNLKYNLAGINGIINAKEMHAPFFLILKKEFISKIPPDILRKFTDLIEVNNKYSVNLIVNDIINSIYAYNNIKEPPMFKALVNFVKFPEYSWHTPGHAGGSSFLASDIGKRFYSFLGDRIFKSDLSISVGELGSLLDHSGPIGESEKYMARVFGADRSYHVTNGSSASNRIILMASITRNQVVLCDRNCHKSLEHALIMSGAIPSYLVPSRNYLGIIGPVKSNKLSPFVIQENLRNNELIRKNKKVEALPVHAILTNSTYDGLCYNIKTVTKLLGQSVDRVHYDEAWYGYARFHSMYKDFYGMSGDPKKYNESRPSIFVTQSTHKLLSAFSQASMIHIKDGRNPINHARFNESFMMHSSTSPFYPIIASNDVNCAMMDEGNGQILMNEAIKEAILFRKAISKINRDYENKNEWFFDIWQPDFIMDKESGKNIPFYKIPNDELASKQYYWILKANDKWHGFGDIEENYCMLDPIKVSVATPGITQDGLLCESGIPAPLVSKYLETMDIIVEKTTNFTVLFLFSIGVTKERWKVLLDAFLSFKNDYDSNKSLKLVMPSLVKKYEERYKNMGLKDLSNAMFNSMKELNITKKMNDAFSVLPHQESSPMEAYEELVRGNVEPLSLDEISTRTVATGIIPYPPGIPIVLSGENVGNTNSAIITYLKALEAFDKQFPGFTHDIHGVEVVDGKYKILCIKKNNGN